MIRLSRGVAAGLLLAAATLAHAGAAAAKPVALSAERLAQLRHVNSHVNATITEVSDMEQYGREDVWALPASGKGDCEDFAMLKRKMLVERGWPASSLSILVGATASGEAHAVLAVSTDQGDLVLDNLTSSILPAARTGHIFHARQSGRGWVSASGERTAEPTADLPVARTVPVASVPPRRRGG